MIIDKIFLWMILGVVFIVYVFVIFIFLCNIFVNVGWIE